MNINKYYYEDSDNCLIVNSNYSNKLDYKFKKNIIK